MCCFKRYICVLGKSFQVAVVLLIKMILYTNCYRWANVDRTNEIKKDAQITFYQICFLYVYASAQVVSVAVEFAEKVGAAEGGGGGYEIRRQWKAIQLRQEKNPVHYYFAA